MSRLLKFAASSVALVSVLALASCSHDTDFEGTWKSTTPADVTTDFPGCRNVMSTISISFAQDENNTDGTVQITDELAVIRPFMVADETGDNTVYANIKGVGSVKGTWSRDIDDADDILVDFDYSTLSVNIDPGAIDFTGISADAVSAEKRDSIAKAVKTEIDIYLRSKLSRFDVLSDMEVDKNRKYMEFEIHSPETDCRFVNADK